MSNHPSRTSGNNAIVERTVASELPSMTKMNLGRSPVLKPCSEMMPLRMSSRAALDRGSFLTRARRSSRDLVGRRAPLTGRSSLLRCPSSQIETDDLHRRVVRIGAHGEAQPTGKGEHAAVSCQHEALHVLDAPYAGTLDQLVHQS